MKIYLAGPCDKENRSLMEHVARILRLYNYEVYCPFELKIDNAWDMPQEEWAQHVFISDICAIDRCDILVMISVGRNSTAGTNWEQGYAYAKQIPTYVFQVNMEPTSLMTYWGCDFFAVAINQDDLTSLILNALNGELITQEKCPTILT